MSAHDLHVSVVKRIVASDRLFLTVFDLLTGVGWASNMGEVVNIGEENKPAGISTK